MMQQFHSSVYTTMSWKCTHTHWCVHNYSYQWENENSLGFFQLKSKEVWYVRLHYVISFSLYKGTKGWHMLQPEEKETLLMKEVGYSKAKLCIPWMQRAEEAHPWAEIGRVGARDWDWHRRCMEVRGHRRGCVQECTYFRHMETEMLREHLVERVPKQLDISASVFK